MVAPDVSHNAIIARALEISGRHICFVAVAGTDLRLLVRLNAGNILTIPYAEVSGVEIRGFEIDVMDSTDRQVMAEVICRLSPVQVQKRLAVEAICGLLKLCRIAQQIVNPVWIKAENVAIGNFVPIVWADIRLRNRHVAHMQVPILIERPRGCPIDRDPVLLHFRGLRHLFTLT